MKYHFSPIGFALGLAIGVFLFLAWLELSGMI